MGKSTNFQWPCSSSQTVSLPGRVTYTKSRSSMTTEWGLEVTAGLRKPPWATGCERKGKRMKTRFSTEICNVIKLWSSNSMWGFAGKPFHIQPDGVSGRYQTSAPIIRTKSDLCRLIALKPNPNHTKAFMVLPWVSPLKSNMQQPQTNGSHMEGDFQHGPKFKFESRAGQIPISHGQI